MVIGDDERQRQYTTRGGLLEVRSQESALQEQREISKLLVVYTSPSDIPPSPTEPSDLPAEGPANEEIFGQPGNETKVFMD